MSYQIYNNGMQTQRLTSETLDCFEKLSRYPDDVERNTTDFVRENYALVQHKSDITQVISNWYWEMDEDFRLTYVSDQISPLLGYLPLELLGRNLLDIGSIPLGLTLTPNLFRGLLLVDLPFEMKERAGETRQFLMNGIPFNDPNTGQFAGWRGEAQVSDWRMITEHELERQLLERTENIQIELAKYKTAETKARREVEKMASASQAKSAFLANMSHELRTPLTAVIGFSDAMKEEIFGKLSDPRYLDYARMISDSGKHLLDLINDILDLSKIEAGEFTIKTQRFDLERLIKHCIKMIKGQGKKAGVELSLHVTATAQKICADELRLKQILLNLLSNGIKFTRPGGEVHVDAWQDLHGAINIKVTDTGIGIDEKDIEQVLKPFGQVGEHAAYECKGSGLGLPLAKSLTELHGGTLSLASRVGQGTTIILSLPQRCDF